MASLSSIAVALAKLGYKKTVQILPTSTAFSTTWDTAGAKDMGDYTITGALALVSTDSGSTIGGYTHATLIADGVHAPTVDGQGLANYNNTNGARNNVKLMRAGVSKYWTCSTASGTLVTVPSAPAITVNVAITQARLNSPLLFTAATVTGNPVPTVTYDAYVDGVKVASGVTPGGSYTLVQTGTVTIHTSAANGINPSATATSPGVVIQSTIDTPEFSMVGTDLTANGYNSFPLSTFGFNRDTNGLVTLTKSPMTNFWGDGKVYFANMSDQTLEVVGQGHYVGDNNLYKVQTSVTGNPISATQTTGVMLQWAERNFRGVFPHVQSAFKGGLKFKGAYAQTGDQASQMTNACTLATAASANFVIIEAGLNDVKGNVASATVIASIKALIDIVTAAGKIAIVISVTPLGVSFSGFAGYNATSQTVNSSISAYCDGTTKIFIDAFTQMFDPTGTSNGGTANGAYSWAVESGLNSWSTKSASIIGGLIVNAINTKITAHELLPLTAPSSVPYVSPVPFATVTRCLGPWTGYTSSTSGFFTGASGSRPDAWTAGRTSGGATAVCSVVDPGDNKGLAFQTVITGSAASDLCVIYPDGLGGSTTTVNGLSIGDDFIVACEITWSNWINSNASGLSLTLLSNGTGIYDDGYTGVDAAHTEGTPAQGLPDSGTMVFCSGVMRVSDAPGTGVVTGGTGYTNGTYTGVSLTGGVGSGAVATVVVAGGVVTTVTVTSSALNTLGYKANDVLSAPASAIGGTGSGFVYTLPMGETSIAPQIQVRFAAASQSGQPLTVQSRRYVVAKVSGPA